MGGVKISKKKILGKRRKATGMVSASRREGSSERRLADKGKEKNNTLCLGKKHLGLLRRKTLKRDVQKKGPTFQTQKPTQRTMWVKHQEQTCF